MTINPADLRCGSCAYREHRPSHADADVAVYLMCCMHPTGRNRTCTEARTDDAACGITARHYMMRYEPSHTSRPARGVVA